jgi:hypothetical protein
MNTAAEAAFFKALAGIKGQVDGRACRAGNPCDLSGSAKGNLTSTDIIDQLEADVERPVPHEIRSEVLKSYIESYNKVVPKESP